MMSAPGLPSSSAGNGVAAGAGGIATATTA
jgi:hypothetical protein